MTQRVSSQACAQPAGTPTPATLTQFERAAGGRGRESRHEFEFAESWRRTSVSGGAAFGVAGLAGLFGPGL